MGLTRKQKTSIAQLKGLSPAEISSRLNLEVVLVQDHLKKRNENSFGDKTEDSDAEIPPTTETSLTEAILFFWKTNQAKLLLVFILGLTAYSTSLPNSFVSDDKPLMASPYLGNPLPIMKSEPVNAIINSLTYTLNFLLHGTDPFGYHLVNVLLHLAVSLAIFFFLGRLLNSRIAFMTALIFVVNPLHTEAVSWISGRHYLLYTFFSLLSLIFYISNNKPKKTNFYYICSIVFFVFAIYSFPEMAIVFPLLLPLTDLYRGQLLKKAKLYLPFFVLAGIFAFLSLNRVQQRVYEVSFNPQLLGEEKINFILSGIIAINTYLKLFLLPFGLSFYHESLSFSTLALLLMGLLVAGLLIVPIIFYKKNRLITFAVGIFIATLIPTLTPFKISWVVAERYAYFGSLGLSILLATSFNHLIGKTSFGHFGKYALGALVITYSLLSLLRGFDWKDEDSLWLATVKVSPGSSKAWNNMGDYYGRHGDPQKSFEAFVQATQLNPTYSDAWHNAGNTLVQMGKYDEAIPYFEKSLQFNPNLIEAYNNLALVYHKKGDGQKSAEMIGKSLQINPLAAKTYSMWAYIEYENKNIEKAKEILKEGLKFNPGNQALQQNLINLEKPQTQN